MNQHQNSQSHEPRSQPDNHETLVLTPIEAANILRISRTNCYEQIRLGNIPSVRIGKRIIVPRAALMRMLEEADRKGG